MKKVKAAVNASSLFEVCFDALRNKNMLVMKVMLANTAPVINNVIMSTDDTMTAPTTVGEGVGDAVLLVDILDT
jgi:hypothetical protein